MWINQNYMNSLKYNFKIKKKKYRNFFKKSNN